MDDHLELMAILLDQGGVSDYYRVGCFLTLMQKTAGPTHGKKFIDQVSKKLKPLCANGASSANHLVKCRKLSEEWTQEFVTGLQERAVPWHAVLKGLFACSQAKSLANQARTKAVKAIQKHLRQFPEARDGKEVKQWLETLTKIKNRFASRLGTGGRLKQLVEAAQAIEVKLQDGKDRLMKIRTLLAPAERTKLDDVIKNLDTVVADARAVLAARVKQLRLESMER